jgi:hypothetical protein
MPICVKVLGLLFFSLFVPDKEYFRAMDAMAIWEIYTRLLLRHNHLFSPFYSSLKILAGTGLGM